MPDESGQLTEEEKQRVRAIVSRPGFSCPVCGSNAWIIADHVVQVSTLGPNNVVQLGGVGYPQVMAISVGCGHTLFFNAVVIGILKPSISETPKT